MNKGKKRRGKTVVESRLGDYKVYFELGGR
jgi:hypothetical protein